MRRILTRVIFGRSPVHFVLAFFAAFLSACGSNPTKDLVDSRALHRQQLADVRVVSWNIRLDSILQPDGARHESFLRIVRALKPDVIGLQEVMKPNGAAELTQLMNRHVPLEEGRSWQVHTVADNALISRYPMRDRGGELVVPYPYPELGFPGFHYGYASALVDLPGKFGAADLYVIAMHNKSGAGSENVRLRQMQSDAIVRWIRNLRRSDPENSIPDNTPIVILGDMNVVPGVSMRPFDTLLTGDIAEEKTFGPDFRIDWDGTDMADAKPSHNAMGREYYTWRNDNLPFAPSALDRIIYTDSVASVRQGFVLNTMTMSGEALAGLGLQKSDVLYGGEADYYDHLPLVVDFVIGAGSRK